MEGIKADWVNVGEVWQMRGTDRDGNLGCVKFTVVDVGIYKEENGSKRYPGAKVCLEDGSETVLSLQQFEYFERLDC